MESEIELFQGKSSIQMWIDGRKQQKSRNDSENWEASKSNNNAFHILEQNAQKNRNTFHITHLHKNSLMKKSSPYPENLTSCLNLYVHRDKYDQLQAFDHPARFHEYVYGT